MDYFSIIYLGVATAVLFALFRKKVLDCSLWRATMTPLASIIGSGFLISAPILHSLAGNMAPYFMLFLCLASFGIGEVIRWNINDVENLLSRDEKGKGLKAWVSTNETVSEWALAFAYVLSITYYLFLFSSFLLKATGSSDVTIQKALVTAILLLIAFFGHQNGLRSLEKLEAVSVNVKLSIIVTFLLGLGVYNVQHGVAEEAPSPDFSWGSVATLLGLLIMVQGFETSRYLGEEYKQKTRIKSMRYSQILSGIIYFLLIFLFLPVFQDHPLKGEISETSVIDIGSHVFPLAPTFLFVAAMASQLSAAVADMGGSGGLFSELTHKKLKAKNAYFIIAGLGILLVWSFNIFSVITLASKAFAIYYFFQCVSSALFQWKSNKGKFAISLCFALLCLCVVIFGRSFE